MGDGESAAAELRGGFETLEVVQPDGAVRVWHIRLNRPAERNALPLSFFLRDLPRALSLLRLLPSPPLALVLSALGPHFCSGLHLPALAAAAAPADDGADPAAAAAALRGRVLAMQEAISALERFPAPVVAAVQGGCVGAGVDLAAACDLRFCEEEAFFAVKEVDLALAADLGTLQRLPGIVGYGNAADLALTGRRVSAAEAKAMGLVSRVFPTRQALDEGVSDVARGLAEKSSIAVMGTKAVLVRSRDLTVEQGLDYVATWNAAMLMSPDLKEAVQAYLHKRRPLFNRTPTPTTRSRSNL